LTVDLVLANAKAYIEKKLVECSLAVDDGKIVKIGKESTMPKAEQKTNLKHLLVLPGLIDAHVHLRDEGKAYKEDFFTGTAAAVAGGFTTVLDMPNNNPVTMSAQTLRNRMEKARSMIIANVGFYSEFPERTEEIEKIAKEGAAGFKLFMIDQVGGLNIDDDRTLFEAFITATRNGIPIAVHAEDKQTIKKTENNLRQEGKNDIEAFLKAHSEEAEIKAVKRLLKIAKETRAQLHFCHITTEQALKAIATAKKEASKVTCEATPHHLFLSADDLRRINTLALMLPPLREKHQQIALWKGVRDHIVDTLGSDHAPHAINEKTAQIVWDVKVGIPGLETTLPLLLNEVNHERLSISDIVRLMAEKPAEIFGLRGKGYLKEGENADITVIALKEKHKIDASQFKSKAKFSPFDGWRVEGKPKKTFVNGQLVMDEGKIVAEAGSGHVIRRE
jgi:dihydroorotase